MDLATAINLIADRSISEHSFQFRDAYSAASAQLTVRASAKSKRFYTLADGTANVCLETAVSTVLFRIYNRRNQPARGTIESPVGYAMTAIHNQLLDQYRQNKRQLGLHVSDHHFVSIDRLRTDEKGNQSTLESRIADTKETELSTYGLMVEELDQLEAQLSIVLYSQEIHTVCRPTPKGKRSFIELISRLQDFQNRRYSPKGSEYKKFDRQRVIYQQHLTEKCEAALGQAPRAGISLQELAELEATDLTSSNQTTEHEEERANRTFRYKIALVALYLEMEQGCSSTDHREVVEALQLNAMLQLYCHQNYRTQRFRTSTISH